MTSTKAAEANDVARSMEPNNDDDVHTVVKKSMMPQGVELSSSTIAENSAATTTTAATPKKTSEKPFSVCIVVGIRRTWGLMKLDGIYPHMLGSDLRARIC